MLRNITLTNNSGRNTSVPEPGVTIYAGVVRTINVTRTSATSANSHMQHRQDPRTRTDESNMDGTINRVYARSAGKDGKQVQFASPLQAGIPFRSKPAYEKTKRLALIRQRRLAKRMKQQVEGARRWNRVLRNRLVAGL